MQMAPVNWNYERTNPRKKNSWYNNRRLSFYWPYSYHSKSKQLWIPNMGKQDRLPMKLIVSIKRAYFATYVNPGAPKVIPSIIQALSFALTVSGDLLHNTLEKISIFTTPSDKYILWRCEACETTSSVSYNYDIRCDETNSVLHSMLQGIFDDPRSNVHKHINSKQHSYRLKMYRNKEMDYWYRFISSSMPDFFERIFK